MKRQTKVCAGCGLSLGEAVLFVNAVSGPTGTFHPGKRCYLDALDRHMALEGPPDRASEAPDAVPAPGAAIGPNVAAGQGRHSWALFERDAT